MCSSTKKKRKYQTEYSVEWERPERVAKDTVWADAGNSYTGKGKLSVTVLLVPVLFLVYIHDIVDFFAKSALLCEICAYDIKIYVEII